MTRLRLHILIFFLIAIRNSSIRAQIFWTETFDASTCVAGSGCSPAIVSWTVTTLSGNGVTPNEWYVSDTESGLAPPSCGAAGMGDQSLHVGNVSGSEAAFLFCPTGDCGAAYDDTGPDEATNKRAESPTINCTGKTNITADFNYLEDGEGNDDNGTFWYFDGSSWTQLDPIAKSATSCAPQGTWTAITTIPLPASANNNPNVKVGFLWVNDGDGNASDPSFAVDDITLCSNCATLPIELISFDATKQENTVSITWATASERNNEFFSVEKSTDGKNWEIASTQKGAGTSDTYHSYQKIDYQPYEGLSYYRLKQTDNNGAFKYSEIKSVEMHLNEKASIYPQPATEQFTFFSNEEYSRIAFYNVIGEKVIAPYEKKADGIQFDISQLPKGIYFLQVANEKGSNTYKVLLQ